LGKGVFPLVYTTEYTDRAGIGLYKMFNDYLHLRKDGQQHGERILVERRKLKQCHHSISFHYSQDLNCTKIAGGGVEFLAG